MKLVTIFLWSLLSFFGGNTNEEPTTDPIIIENQLMQEWVLVDGWLDKDSLVFEQKDTSVHHSSLYKVFTFSKDSKMDYQLYNPNKYRLCGVGMVGLQNTSWHLEDEQYLVLHAKGQRWGESQFEYKTRYFIQHISDKQLKLVVDRRLKNVEKEF